MNSIHPKMEHNYLKIIQWNIRGFISNKANLEILIQEQSPDIVCLQETFLKNKQRSQIKDYNIIRKDRNMQVGGGVLIAVHKKLGYIEIEVDENLEANGIKVKIDNTIISIINIYFPPKMHLDNTILNKMIDKASKYKIIVGDFNAHHISWDLESNSKGKEIAKWIKNNNLTVLNRLYPTYFHKQTNKYSNIDLALVNFDKLLKWELEILDDLCGSDHFPISIRHRYNIQKCNHQKKPTKINRITVDPNILKIDQSKDINETNNQIVQVLNSTSKAKDKPIDKYKENRNKIWWNQECGDAIKDRKKAFKKFRKYPTTSNWIDYKKRSAKAKRTVIEAKRQSFNLFLDNLNQIPTNRELWCKIKSLQGKKNYRTPIMLEDRYKGCISDQKLVAQCFLEHFTEIYDGTRKSPEFIKYIIQYKNQLNSNMYNENYEFAYNRRLTVNELEQVLKNKKRDTSPGCDEVTYEQVKSLNKKAKEQLIEFYNIIWNSGKIPVEWKISTIIPILKPMKPKDKVESYRPISLTSVLSKVMEKIVKNRLEMVLDMKGYSFNNQYGFKKRFSTFDCILELEGAIRRTILHSEICMAVFIDIKGAYDNVWPNRLDNTLQNIGIKGNLLKFLHNFTKDRQIQIRIGSDLSKRTKTKYGLPQGTILSPILFNILLLDILKSFTCNYTCYADDIVIWESGQNIIDIRNKIQENLNIIANELFKCGLEISGEKTKYMIFTNKSKIPIYYPIKIENKAIERVNKFKYLGMYFDSKLTWKYHIKHIKEICMEKLNIMKFLSHSKWGANRKLLRKIYITLIRPVIEYGIFIYYPPLSQSNKTQIDRIQYKGLRYITGAIQSTIVDNLAGEVGLLNFNYRAKLLALKFLCTRIQIFNHPTTMKIESFYPFHFYELRPFPIPTYGYLKKLYQTVIKPRKIAKIHYLADYQIADNIAIDIRLCKYNKKQIPKEKIIQEYIEIRNFYSENNFNISSTDGSRANSEVGSAVISNKKTYKYKLPPHSSIFTAEALAILKAIQITKAKNNLIISDSLSAILAIKNNSNHFLINKIIEELKTTQNQFTLFWVPSHVGIKENEIVDKAATEARVVGAPQNLDHSLTEIINYYKHYIKKECLEEWQSLPYFTPKINPKYEDDIEYCNLNRREQVVLARLRLKCTRLTLAIFCKDMSAPICDCGVELTLTHIFSCQRYKTSVERLKRKKNMKELTLEKLLMVGESPTDLLKFLRDVDVFDTI